MKRFFQGINYNIKGVKMGLRDGKLFMLGMVRFVILMVITITAAAMILANYQEILNLMWNQPQSLWIAWLWHLLSWILALVLIAVSAVASFLIAQLFFSVVIMDSMSKVTERIATGLVKAPNPMPWYIYFFYLLRQEIPRAFLPILISLILLVLGWFTPLGPVLTVVSPLAAGIFLAWDNTDLTPARRMVPFNERVDFLKHHLMFHIGFGVLFIIPVLNLLLLSFAPVGATLYYIDQMDTKKADGAPSA